MDLAHSVDRARKTTSLEICDLTADILILIFSLLCGQDIARCTRVCRDFLTLIDSDLFLQYKITLAQNGMVDGHSSTISTSERLQRLRDYSSKFCDGIFDHEDLGSHPLYLQQLRDRQQDRTIAREHFTSNLYSQDGRSDVSLSIFTPGSTQAAIRSSRHLLPIGTAGEPGFIITEWAIDGAQDLLVIAETFDMYFPEPSRRRPDEFYIRFYSLSGSKTAWPTPHSGAMLPSLHSFAPGAGISDDFKPTANITELHIAGQYVFWVLAVEHGEHRRVSVEVCNWRTGTVISSIDVGIKLVNVVPLDYPYLLIIPDESETYPESLSIHNFSPHDIPGYRVCTLQLPSESLELGEYIRSHVIYNSDRPQTAEGHFLPDMSRSMVALTLYTEGLQVERETHYLIPCTVLLAHVQATESRQTLGTDGGGVHSIPWEDWGPQGCLRLCSCHSPQWSLLRLVPFGSRFPLVVFDDPKSDIRVASVYIFDIDPLAARYRRQTLAESRNDSKALADSEEQWSIAVVDNIDEVLPGVIDPDCSSIPYVAYRFKLPYSPREWPDGHSINSVVMSMTGFTVKFSWLEEERTEQTWTV